MTKQKYNQDYVYGDEPDWTKTIIYPSIYQSELGSGLYYYGNTISASKRKEWAISGLTSEYNFTKEQLSPIPEFYLERIGSIFRMIERGFIMQKGHMDKILTPLPNLIERFKKVKVKKSKSIRKDVNLDSQYEIFDSLIDKVITGKIKRWDTPELLSTLTNVNLKTLIRHYNHDLKDIEGALNKTSKDLVEAYSNVSRDDLKLYVKLYIELIELLESHVTKVVRKPRKKKPISKSKQVSKLHYLEKCDILGISSIKPRDIIGKRNVLVYNTVNKALMFFEFNNPDGALVKGSTMIGFDEKSSSSKTIRKPDEKLKAFIDATSIKASRIYNDIRAVAKPLTGRVNKNCIILKVF